LSGAAVARTKEYVFSSGLWSNTRLAMAKKSKDARVYVIMECTETGQRTYMAQKNNKNGYKLELKKYNPKLRKHTIYKERKK
jgi:large subunit ribosomal protein L33